MSRRVIFTEQQLKEILGEEAFNGAYNDMNSQGSEYPENSIVATAEEVSQTEPGGKPKTLDNYGKQKIETHPWLRRSYYALYEGKNGKKKVLSERNKELDDKKIFTLPKNLRRLAVSNGQNDKIMQHIANGDKMSIQGLYRMRKELENNPNTAIKNGIDKLIQQAQNQGAALRNVNSNVEELQTPNANKGTGKGHRKQGNTRIYYQNN